MKFSKKLLVSSVAASAIAFSALAPVANAEVSASVGVANMYLWRGFNLGDDGESGSLANPAVWGDLNFGANGFTAGIWTSSGDTFAGTEYDLYAGYSGEAGDFSYGVTLVSYIYPSGPYKETEGPGDFMEAIVSLGYGPVSFSYYDNIAGETGGYAPSEDYTYMTLSAEVGSFGFLVGQHDEGAGDATHFDASYNYNDNLAFTVSTILDSDLEDDEADPLFVVSYTLPIE